MLSPAYVNIYQQYKADTDSIAAWLATTAKADGFDEQNVAAKKAEAGENLKQKKKKKKGNGKGKDPGC